MYGACCKSVIIYLVCTLNATLLFKVWLCSGTCVCVCACTQQMHRVTEDGKHGSDNIRQAMWKHFKGVYCSLRGRRRQLITTAISHSLSLISHFLIRGRHYYRE